jgi:hypothetical protein
VRYEQQNWQQCLAFAESALASTDATTHATDPDAKGKAADLAAVAAWNLGKRPEALTYAEAALRHFPADSRIVNNVTEMRQQLAQAS